MHRFSILILVMWLFVPAVFAQGKSGSTESGGRVNGRGWMMFSHMERATYIRAIWDTCKVLNTYETIEPMPKSVAQFCGKAMPDRPLSELSEQITLFYKDPATRNVPVTVMIRFAGDRLSGEGDDEVNEDIEWARKAWADANN
ncbi:MAG: hypothetical protein ACYC7A_21735 [Thermoanaerobaculia bacterium]